MFFGQWMGSGLIWDYVFSSESRFIWGIPASLPFASFFQTDSVQPQHATGRVRMT